MKIVGHKKQTKFLEDILQSENKPQAYLFSGPEGVGKFSIAKLFADSLNKGVGGIEQTRVSEELKNSDVEILAPEEIEKKGVVKIKNITVERVREAQKNLSLYPLSGDFRVLIINNAHGLSIASQNTLLKTLEEPNGTSIIVLVTHEAGSILDTIRSRCQCVNFNLVALDEIRRGFQKRVSEKDLEKISIFSMGRPGEVKKFIGDNSLLSTKELFIKDLGRLATDDLIEKMFLAEKYSKNIPQSVKILEFWVWFLRIQIFRSLEDKAKTKRYYRAIKKITDALEKLENPSLNGRLILENLFLAL